MDKQTEIRGKIFQIKKELHTWLVQQKLINKGDRIPMEVVIELTSQLTSNGPSSVEFSGLLKMKILDFFTEERMTLAGVNTSYLARIKFLEDPKRYVKCDSSDCAPEIVLVQDLYTAGATKILRFASFGTSTLQMMSQVLVSVGLKEIT
ncbi:MAG TPA: hypothetical protein PLF31_00170 [Candidatus Paceibacterota bacterium]|nr:hypothetical protein [Candidatus Paceibacterota bacterium]